MGVPAFFRWLRDKYPKCIVDAVEVGYAEASHAEDSIEDEGATSSRKVNITDANPNGIEFDNLYIDMNGLIHPCVHPEDHKAPDTLEEMFIAICNYVDRLMAVVRPRKLLYMAIDGVAPRAKMNQQRSRRFKTGKELDDLASIQEETRKEMAARGQKLPPKSKKKFDYNVITPGTDFMLELAKHVRFYVADRLHNDPGWADLTVIFSDASVPGEGEHKIMGYIRNQRSQKGYDPNTRHVLHGLDADLIMLGLATHEVHFSILREEVLPPKGAPRKCFLCGGAGHNADRCTGQGPKQAPKNKESAEAAYKPLQFLHLWVLREYLTIEFSCLRDTLPPTFPFDMERIIDDFVFLCFFCGNDFLPHLPCLDIREGAIDLLIHMYKAKLPSLGSYLTKGGEPLLEYVDVLLAHLAGIENEIFRRRKDDKDFQERRRRRHQPPPPPPVVPPVVATGGSGGGGGGGGDDPRGKSKNANSSAAAAMKELLGLVPASDSKAESVKDNGVKAEPEKKETVKEEGAGESKEGMEGVKSEPTDDAKEGDDAENSDEADALDELGNVGELKWLVAKKLSDAGTVADVKDEVMLGVDGWHDRYYTNKFGEEDGMDPNFVRGIAKSYVEGLVWVYRYYYKGVASWTWYFPYHYAPFATDLRNIDEFDIKLEKGKPFRPLDQLMAVFPARSAHALPKACRELMTSPSSPIFDFYPENFKQDPNGKKFTWQWVVLLPFIEEKRLLEAIDRVVMPTLTDKEKEMNMQGEDMIFVRNFNDPPRDTKEFREAVDPAGSGMKSIYKDHSHRSVQGSVMRLGLADTRFKAESFPLFGTLPSPCKKWKKLENLQAIVGSFQPPASREHLCCILDGARPPASALKEFERIIRIPRVRGPSLLDLAGFTQRGGGGGRGGGGRYGQPETYSYRMGVTQWQESAAKRPRGHGPRPHYDTHGPRGGHYGSHSHPRPSHGSYGGPPARPSYGAPSYGAPPRHGYGAPHHAPHHQSYGAPPPRQSYGGYSAPPPRPSYGGYGAPPPRQAYGAPRSSYGAPPHHGRDSYGAPPAYSNRDHYSRDRDHYSRPQSSYSAAPHASSPPRSYGAPPQRFSHAARGPAPGAHHGQGLLGSHGGRGPAPAPGPAPTHGRPYSFSPGGYR